MISSANPFNTDRAIRMMKMMGMMMMGKRAPYVLMMSAAMQRPAQGGGGGLMKQGINNVNARECAHEARNLCERKWNQTGSNAMSWMRAARMHKDAAQSSSASGMSAMTYFQNKASYECITASVTSEGVGVVTLSRPKQLNALNETVMREVVDAVQRMDADNGVGAVVLTGDGDKAFAAGADIKEMANVTAAEAVQRQMLSTWEELGRVRIPLVAAVNGYALGGGCELAMMCDIIIASDKASFGQPEILLGTTPGMGGSQRLTKLVGKSKAMDMVLTGRRMAADEAERAGLASRVVPHEKLMESALEIGTQIAGMSRPAAAACKECVNVALESSLAEGLRYERRSFWATFATHDQKEGMSAFMEKRKPAFKHC